MSGVAAVDDLALLALGELLTGVASSELKSSDSLSVVSQASS